MVSLDMNAHVLHAAVLKCGPHDPGHDMNIESFYCTTYCRYSYYYS
eukprot:COSAG02_NODE_2131_length_9725_cov_239.696343_1_plen_45_part_10